MVGFLRKHGVEASVLESGAASERSSSSCSRRAQRARRTSSSRRSTRRRPRNRARARARGAGGAASRRRRPGSRTCGRGRCRRHAPRGLLLPGLRRAGRRSCGAGEGYLVMSFPRPRWLIRVGLGAMNVGARLLRWEYRTWVYPRRRRGRRAPRTGDGVGVPRPHLAVRGARAGAIGAAEPSLR